MVSTATVHTSRVLRRRPATSTLQARIAKALHVAEVGDYEPRLVEAILLTDYVDPRRMSDDRFAWAASAALVDIRCDSDYAEECLRALERRAHLERG